MRPLPFVLSAATAAVLAMACGGSSSSSGTASAPAPTPRPVLKIASAVVGGTTETILVGENGLTLYHFTPDKGAGKVTCTGTCMSNWPPLLAPTGVTTPTGEKGVTGKLGTIASPNGGLQVTYNGWPLYFWIKDQNPGDTTGQGVVGKWFVVPPDLPVNA